MARHRLLNCSFINSGQYTDLSNKAKLLYIFMFTNADDCGFVDNVKNWIILLDSQDKQALELINDDYKSALEELGNMGLIYVFTNKYGHKVYLIRHWFLHNKWKKGLLTTYGKYRSMVELQDFEYIWKESSKESKTNQNNDKIKHNNLNQNNYSWEEVMEELGETDETDNI